MSISTPLNASATSAGALFSKSIFEVPRFQREYAWTSDEVVEFWSDLKRSLCLDDYFLGLVILTDEDGRKQIVDGQQRLITLTLLAAVILHEAKGRGRNALADRIQADFLKSINYETDETEPRIVLADEADNEALQYVVNTGESQKIRASLKDRKLSSSILDSFDRLKREVRSEIANDPFKHLGAWAEFITNKLYFAVFVHPDSASAYRVFEVINTRGVELTTADLLKNYILSQVKSNEKERLYSNWRYMANQIEAIGEQSLVQFIRHVVTSYRGHIPPKDLFDYLAERQGFGSKKPFTPKELIEALDENLRIYIQMMDPRQEGPADLNSLKVFSSLNELSVIAVRPIMLSILETPNSDEGMRYVLKLVVRRIVVGTLGTGNVERRFGEAAKRIRDEGAWEVIKRELEDLNPTREEFLNQVGKRSFNKKVLGFLRRSIIQNTITPSAEGVLHSVRPRNSESNEWPGFGEEETVFLVNTLGNTFLCNSTRRGFGADTWSGFKKWINEDALEGEFIKEMQNLSQWRANEVRQMGEELASVAEQIWY